MTWIQIVKYWKKVVLTTLVLTSFVLSYLLWNGNWKNTTEVGLATINTLPPSNFPREQEALAPYRIVFTAAKSSQASVIVPGDSVYQEWLSELGASHISNLHMVGSVPTRTFARIEFDFPANLDRSTMLTWLPNLTAAPLPAEGRVVQLYTLSQSGPVFVAIESSTANYVGQTDLSASDLTQSVLMTVHRSPWISWDGQTGDYVPSASQTMDRLTWQMSLLPLLPVVHSFFVNPQILTRIQENSATVVWTDGSRAVQWAQQDHSLTFEDPNLTDHIPYAEPDLNTGMSFIRNHGGSPQNVVAIQVETLSGLSGANAYTFLPLLNGYPIYGPQFAYMVEVYRGHIVQYKRPLIEMTKQVSVSEERLLAPGVIRSTLMRAIGEAPLSSIQVKLGYCPMTTSSMVTFIPAFYVYTNGNLLKIVDASTGAFLPKGGQS